MTTAVILAQPVQQRQAAMIGGGGADRGKCTVEVVVDDVAQVEIRGASATLRTMAGQPAQWRRFECTGPMPSNAGNFRFAGVDGRGRQQLIRDPRNGGAAVVQIEDKDGGSEGYTFDIFWDGGNGGQYNGGQNNSGPPNGGQYNGGPGPGNGGDRRDYDRDQRGPGGPPPFADNDGYRPNYKDGDYYRRYGHGFGTDEAVRVCQDAVYTQAQRRFRTSDIHFRRTRIDDNPGRQDWVMGTLDTHRGQREERYGFSCSVDFSSGRVRTATLDPRPLGDDSRWR